MKKLIFVVIFGIYSITNAQIKIDYGVKTGLNYTVIGDLTISGGIAGFNEKVTSERGFGFHAGMYTQLNFSKLYIRPELVFTKTSSTYNHILSPASEFKLSTLEIPVLVGFKIIKPISVYIGPTFQYILNNEFSTLFDLNTEHDIVMGLNFGATVEYKKFGIDLRYSPGLSENLAVDTHFLHVDGFAYSINTRSDQIIFSFSYMLN